MDEAKTMEAVGDGRGTKRRFGNVVEQAFAQAIRDCYAEGISDPAEHKKRMMEYRALVRAGQPLPAPKAEAGA